MLFTRFYLVAFTVLIADIVTKWIVYNNLTLGGPSVEVLGSWLRWTYIHNSGAAFGLFQGSRALFIGVSILSSLVILGMANRRRYQNPWTLLAFGMILGGAIGNLLDRIWLGRVIDFIDVGIGRHRWPYFNVADSGISVGVTLLTIRLLFDRGHHGPEPEEEAAQGELNAETRDRDPNGRGGGALREGMLDTPRRSVPPRLMQPESRTTRGNEGAQMPQGGGDRDRDDPRA